MRVTGTLVMVVMAAALAATPAPGQRTSSSDELLSAIRGGDNGKIASLIQANGASAVNGRGFDGWTPLTAAAKQRNLAYVSFLLGNKADPNIANRDGETPLLIATRIGWGDGVSLLIESGAKVDATNQQGETPLIVAVQARNLRLVRLLLEAGADPDKSDRAAGMSAREYAHRDNRVRDLSRLIDVARPAKP